MPLYRVLKGKLFVNKRICLKGDEVVLKQCVAKSFGAGCLELIESMEPEKPLVFITQPERNLPQESEPDEEPQVEEEQEEEGAMDTPPPSPARSKGRPRKKKRKR